MNHKSLAVGILLMGPDPSSTVSVSALPTTSLNSDGNGIYTIGYNFLIDANSLSLAGYYDTPTNDTDNNASTVDSEYTYFRAVNQEQQDAAEIIMHVASGYDYRYSAFYGDVAKINFFSETSYSAEIIFGQNDEVSPIYYDPSIPADEIGGFSNNYQPNSGESEYQIMENKYGDVWLNEDFILSWNNHDLGKAQLYTILHEMGHSLGLSHPQDLSIDDLRYTIMSSNFMFGMNDGNGDYLVPSGLQLYDILAIQNIYQSRNYDTRNEVTDGDPNTTGTLYDKAGAFASSATNDAFIYTIWDGGGIDTISADGFYEGGIGAGASYGSIIDLRQGMFSTIGSSVIAARAVDNVAIAYYTIIENATGSIKSDTLIGNAWDNVLIGGEGNDELYGDGYVYDENAGFVEGDAWRSWGGGNLAPASDHSGNDTLIGGNGNDTLYGGAGNDVLNGSAGNDIYKFDTNNGNDTINDSWTENNGLVFSSGIFSENIYYQKINDDLVISWYPQGSITLVNYFLSSQTNLDLNFEYTQDLIKIGREGIYNGNEYNNIYGNYERTTSYFDSIVAFGHGGNDTLIGYGGNDYLDGGAGDDIVHGFGGRDVLIGGAGNDSIYTYSKFNGDHADIDGGVGNDSIRIDGKTSPSSSSNSYSVNGGADNDEYQINIASALEILNIFDPSGNDIYLKLGRATTSVEDASGNDYYKVAAGTNSLVINDTGGDDQIWLPLNYSFFSYAVQNENDLKISIRENNFIFIEDYFSIYENKIEQVRFNDTDFFSTDYLLNISLYVIGTNNANTLNGNSSDNIILGFGGNDILNGNEGNDAVYGDIGNDTLHGNNGADSLYGGDGDDILTGGAGNDTLSGGNGIDTVSYANAAAGMAANLQGNVSGTDGDGGSDTFSSVENITGSGFGDVIYGSAGANVIYGGAGNDELRGYGGDDTIYGQSGNDVIYGYASGNETIYGGDDDDIINAYAGNDTIDGGAGNDNIYTTADAQVDGGSGTNKLYFTESLYGVAANLSTGAVSDTNGASGSAANFKIVYGSDYGDTLTGNDDAETISGRSGNDVLNGGGGNDSLYGDAGNDTLHGDDGNDTLYGYEDDDILHGDAGDDLLYAHAGADTLYGGDGAEYLYGMDGNDTIYGGNGNDRLYGDKINSGDTWTGSDTLYGEAGNDIINAHDGNDLVYGGAGADTMNGGNGVDTFAWNGADLDGSLDTIGDFSVSGGDKIDVSDVLDGAGYNPLVDLLSDFLRFTEGSGGTVFYIDTAGTGTFSASNDVVTLSGVTDLLAGGSGTNSAELDLQNMVSSGTLVV